MSKMQPASGEAGRRLGWWEVALKEGRDGRGLGAATPAPPTFLVSSGGPALSVQLQGLLFLFPSARRPS